MPLLTGESLNQRYRILHVLAVERYGVTYRGRDVKAGRSLYQSPILHRPRVSA